MKIRQTKWTSTTGWQPQAPAAAVGQAQLVLVFGAPGALREPGVMDAVRAANPAAHLFGCSTSGEIAGTVVSDEALILTAVEFERTQVRGARVDLAKVAGSLEAGVRLTEMLPRSVPGPTGEPERLVHVLVLSDGLKVNGSALAKGLTEGLPAEVTVTGGLAGDGPRFVETLVLWDSTPQPNAVAVVGLYGSRLKVGFGSLGGWDPFGPERLVTRSSGNVLYELDGQSALGLYRKYLGDHAKGLPAAGLLFPLCVRSKGGDPGVVRTILAVDDREQSITFAGDMPEGAYARFMKANFDRLIDGATGAAETSYEAVGAVSPELAILISCVGRKLVLKQRVEEEVEGVREVLGEGTPLTGFYSYGEISPFEPGARCELHNQTMTITTLREV
jgi:hypothetical protein